MSIMTTRALKNSRSKIDSYEYNFASQLTVLTMIKTMLEIIKIKKDHMMDKETKKQFPMIAREIIFLAEQTQ